MVDSLFGHLVSRFSTSPENLATESLLYILQRSMVAKRAFFRYLEQTGCSPLPDNLRLASQSMDKDDQSIPDLVGFDDKNKPMFICESKFWAGLTGNQPVTYLKQLTKSSGSLLLILGPSKRIATLWPELVRRVKDARYQVEQGKLDSKEMESITVNSKYVLAFASWRSILSILSYALETESDMKTLSDLEQLQGLCDQMDSDAFLPLRSEELTANIGQRIRHYCDLVDETAAKLGKNEVVKLEGLRASGSRGWYGRYMFIQHYGCLLQFNANFWAKYHPTPMWLSIQDARGKRWGYSTEAREKLATLEAEEPPRLLQDGEYILIPIYLPYGVEKAEVIDSIYQEVKEIANLLAK